MNTVVLSTIAQYPGVFFGKLIVEALPGAAFAYAIVWLLLRPRGISKLPNSGRLHFFGIAATLVASALFRVIAMATFAGKSAFDPPSTSGALGFYILIVPGVFAAGYIFFLRKYAFNKSHQHSLVGEQSTSRRLQLTRSEEIDDAVYANISKELESGALDRGLWTRLYGECDGDEAKTKAAYIRNRAVKLSCSSSGSIPPGQPSQSGECSADEDRIPIDKKVGFVIIGAIVFGLIVVVSQMGKPRVTLVDADESFPAKGAHCEKHSDCPAGPPAQMCNLQTKRCYVLERQLY